MEPTLQNVSDGEFARRCQAGSLRDFEELVTRYEARVYRFLLRRTGSAHDAQDLAQQAFVNAYRAIGHYDGRRPFAPWLFTIARRLADSHYRRRAAQPDGDGGGELPEPVDARTPDAPLEAREAESALWDWVRGQLPSRQFTALWLRVQEDMTVRDVAAAMGLTGLHVKVLLHRARRRLAAAWPVRGTVPEVGETRRAWGAAADSGPAPLAGGLPAGAWRGGGV